MLSLYFLACGVDDVFDGLKLVAYLLISLPIYCDAIKDVGGLIVYTAHRSIHALFDYW